MIVFHSRHHGKMRLHPQKHTVILVSLDYELSIISCVRIRTQIQGLAADYVGRVSSQSREHVGDHSSGCRLPVSTSDGNNPLTV